MRNNKILAIIPARGGSKGVPRKNIRNICDKPLIAWTIEAALEVQERFCDVIVSTDDEEIANTARKFGANIPFMRSESLGGDNVAMLDVLKDVVSRYESTNSLTLDWVCLLQPTVPMRTGQDIAEILDLAMHTSADSVISVVQVFSTHPVLMKRIVGGLLVPFMLEEKEGTRRQDYEPEAYMRNGAVYLSRRDNIMKRGSIWGDSILPYVMPEDRSVNIDSMIDFKVCEVMMRELAGRVRDI